MCGGASPWTTATIKGSVVDCVKREGVALCALTRVAMKIGASVEESSVLWRSVGSKY